ncbi:MAG: hypothetical protein MZW92_40070 [Comamonadaceae bacterium]|nr:hypothetical protein [Comamonadaceae bacterium]
MTVRENVQLALARARRRCATRSAGARGAHARPRPTALLERVGIERARPTGAADARLRRRQARRARARAGRRAAAAADGRADRRHGAARARRADGRCVARPRRERGRVAVLFTEHDMDVVFGHADRVIVMDRGRIIASGAPDAVRADAARAGGLSRRARARGPA